MKGQKGPLTQVYWFFSNPSFIQEKHVITLTPLVVFGPWQRKNLMMNLYNLKALVLQMY